MREASAAKKRKAMSYKPIYNVPIIPKPSKEELERSDPNQKPVDFIRSKPNLIKVLKWFDEIEDQCK